MKFPICMRVRFWELFTLEACKAELQLQRRQSPGPDPTAHLPRHLLTLACAALTVGIPQRILSNSAGVCIIYISSYVALRTLGLVLLQLWL